MITFIHSNGAKVSNGILRVDRKFLTGMRRYAELLQGPLTTIHPELSDAAATMDLVEVPYDEVGFKVVTIPVNATKDEARKTLTAVIAASDLVYGYTNWDMAGVSRSLNIPYVLILEYDLKTQITINASGVSSLLRKCARALRSALHYALVDVPAMRHAQSLHCNGYPIYRESALFNTQRLLYLDSRMSENMVIAEAALHARLASRQKRPLKLLFSGRYEKIKGASDAVRVGIECVRRGLPVEMHCYGQGGLKDEMRRLVAAAGCENAVFVHDAIPYPELVLRSYEFDLFVCCHIQSDPSCTYLEAYGAGLPVVGYANRMWKHLSQASGIGSATPMRRINPVVESVASLIQDPGQLDQWSRAARKFALRHTFESEFQKRVEGVLQQPTLASQ